MADGRDVSVDKATDWFLEKAELQAPPSVTFHIPESQMEDLGAALGPPSARTSAWRCRAPGSFLQPFCSRVHLACLINGAPPLLPLQFCCSLSACPFSCDWHSQPSADSLKLGLQPCSLSSAPDPPTRKPLATPDHPRLAAPSNDAVKPGGLFPRGHAHPF